MTAEGEGGGVNQETADAWKQGWNAVVDQSWSSLSTIDTVTWLAS
jgi:hypothetical protein